MAKVLIPTALRRHVQGLQTVEMTADSVGQLIDRLVAQYPALRGTLLTPQGGLTRFVGIYVNSADCRENGGMGCVLASNDVVELLLPIAGG